MKIRKIAFYTVGIISSLLFYLCFPLMIYNIGKDWTLFAIYLSLFVVGFIGLCICAIIIMRNKKKSDVEAKTLEENIAGNDDEQESVL